MAEIPTGVSLTISMNRGKHRKKLKVFAPRETPFETSTLDTDGRDQTSKARYLVRERSSTKVAVRERGKNAVKVHQ